MKILFLDDEIYRHEAARKAFDGHDMYSVFDIKSFQRVFVEEDWDLICLDHDLSEHPCTPNGKAAARLVARSGKRYTVWIHSWNVPESLIMESILFGACKILRATFGPESLRFIKKELNL